ncbi:MAG: hypothetical protein AB8G17_20800 [Gammaproteobacteria bacterium]
MDRRRDVARASQIILGNTYHAWHQRPLSDVDDVEYVRCALFEKCTAV